jgi:hypothetical protein
MGRVQYCDESVIIDAMDFSTAIDIYPHPKTVTLKKLSSLCQRADDDVEWHKLLDSTRAVLCTLINTAGSTSLRKTAQPKFDLLLLDEAGQQCPESEFCIATKHTKFPG